MDEVKIHSGTRVRLKRIDLETLPDTFTSRIREYAHADERVHAIWALAIEPAGQPEQSSLVVAVKSGLFQREDAQFLALVDEIQMLLPEDLAFNIYRFGASPMLAAYCAQQVEPLYLRSQAWLDKQRRKHR